MKFLYLRTVICICIFIVGTVVGILIEKHNSDIYKRMSELNDLDAVKQRIRSNEIFDALVNCERTLDIVGVKVKK